MKKAKKVIRVMSIFIGIIAMGVIIMGFFPLHFKKTVKVNDNIKYINQIIQIDLSSYSKESTGEIKINNGEERAMIKVRIADDAREKVKALLEQKAGESEDITTYIIPRYQDHKLALDLKEKKLTGVYTIFEAGNKAKTRNINIYLAEDKTGTLYLYLFG